MTAVDPIRLGPNQPAARPYLGGAGILTLRGEGSTAPDAPEDWVASTTAANGTADTGLTVLPDGRTLRDAVAADPVGWLGTSHVQRFGADTALLVKILDTGERLFNHVHPDAAFAREHLGTDRGKTEAWLITATASDEPATVWVGFRRDVSAQELADWFRRQDIDAMLCALNRVSVRAGDWVHVPAGTPHAIGPGITLVELQEPSDLSIVLEYAPFPALNREQALLGLPEEVALAAVDRSASGDRLDGLHGTVADRVGRTEVLPAAAAPFYRAEQVVADGSAPVTLDAGFAVLVMLDGSGTLGWADGSFEIRRGTTVVVPFGAGETSLRGDLTVIRCRPPA